MYYKSCIFKTQKTNKTINELINIKYNNNYYLTRK